MEAPLPLTDDGARRRGLLVLAGLTGVLTVVRLVLALRADSLTSLPDEFGFLGDAWILGRGEPAPPMAWAPFYKGAYPVLLAPVALLTSNTDTLATAARVLDVVLLALLAPALWALLGRLGRLEPTSRAVVAVAATAVPGLWIAGLRAWPDALLAVGWVAALLALRALLDHRAATWKRAWFGPAVAALAAGHDRFLPVAIAAAVLLVVRIARPVAPVDDEDEPTWPSRGADILNLGLALLVVAVGWLLDARVATRWDQIADGAISRFFDAPGATLTSMVGALVGQAWYACTATFGLAAVGAASLGAVVWSHRRRVSALWSEPLPAVALFAVVGAVLVQVAAALQIGDANAYGDAPVFDLFANGRYQEVTLAPLVAVGIARLARRGHRSLRLEAIVAGAMVVLAGLTTVMVGNRPPIIDSATAAGTTWLLDLWRDRPVAAPTVVGLLVLAGFVLLRPAPGVEVGRARAAAVPVLALLALAVPGYDSAARLVDDSRSRQRVPDASAARAEIDGEPVGYALDVATLGAATPVGWALAGEEVITYEPADDEPPAELVIAPALADDTPAVEGLDGWEVVAEIPISDLGGRPLRLWRSS